MRKLLMLLVSFAFLSSCASSFKRGSVAMKIDDKTSHVCLGDNDVQVGDKVEFLTHSCNTDSVGQRDAMDYVKCKLKVLGTGEVTKILNTHYSEVKTDGSFKFSEKTLIQKKKI